MVVRDSNRGPWQLRIRLDVQKTRLEALEELLVRLEQRANQHD